LWLAALPRALEDFAPDLRVPWLVAVELLFVRIAKAGAVNVTTAIKHTQIREKRTI
jgi:hypothetical protein